MSTGSLFMDNGRLLAYSIDPLLRVRELLESKLAKNNDRTGNRSLSFERTPI